MMFPTTPHVFLHGTTYIVVPVSVVLPDHVQPVLKETDSTTRYCQITVQSEPQVN